jgi:hypothetical protein
LEYFEASLQFLLKKKSKRYWDVGTNKPVMQGRLSDGCVSYSDNYTHPDTLKVAGDARLTGAKPGISEPDAARIKLLEELLDFLREKKVKVHLIMIPYHPEYYKACLEAHPRVMKEWAPLFREIAAKYDLPLSGGFDADSLGMPVTVFYDMYHCSGESIKHFIPIH